MPGRLIFASYMRGFSKSLMQVVVLFSIVACLVNFVEFSRRVGGAEYFSVLAAAQVAIFKLPQLLTEVMPFGILLAAMLFLRLVNRRGELTILRAAGMPAIGFLLPLLFASAGFGVLTIAAIDPLAPVWQSYANAVTAAVRGRISGAESRPEQAWLSQQIGDGLLFIGGTQSRSSRIDLQNSTFLEFDSKGQMVSRRDAKSAQVQDGQWVLRDVVLLKPGAAPVSFPNDRIATTLDAKKVRWQFVGVNEISIYEMPQAMRAFRDMGLPTTRLFMRLLTLLSTPFMFMAMVLIAAPMSILFSRNKQDGAMIGSALAAGFVMHSLVVLAQAFGKAEAVTPWIAVPFPVILALCVAWFWLHRMESVG